MSDEHVTRQRVERELGPYLQHDSWRCEHPPHFYLPRDDAAPPLPKDYCPCGLVGALRALGLNELADGFIPRSVEDTEPLGGETPRG